MIICTLKNNLIKIKSKTSQTKLAQHQPKSNGSYQPIKQTDEMNTTTKSTTTATTNNNTTANVTVSCLNLETFNF